MHIPKYIFFSLFFMVTVSSYAQKLDSLLKALATYHKEDTVKLDLLNSTANEYQNVDPTKGEETANNAIELAQKLYDNRRFAEALMMKAHNELRLRNMVGAEDLYEKTLIKFQQLMNKKGVITCLIGLGNINLNSDAKKAMDYYDKALNINEQLRDKERMAAILAGKGVAYKNLADYIKALETLKKAVSICQQLGEAKTMSYALSKIGEIYSQLGDYETELSYYQKALAISEKTGQKISIAVSLNGIGTVYYQVGEYSKALEYFRKALVIYRQISEKLTASTLTSIALIYSRQSNYNEDITYLLESIKIDEENGSKVRIAEGLNNIGFAYYKLYNYPRAWGYYQKGLSISQETGNKNDIAIIFLSIGELTRDTPDSILTQIGINPIDRYTKTLEYLNKGLQVANEVGSIYLQRSAWQDLSIMYENQKDYGKAFDSYKHYIIIRDSLLNNEKEKKLSHLEMQYEFDKKKDSVELQKQVTDEKLKQQLLLDKQQQQQIELGKKELALTNQQKDLQNLAYLKTQADLQNEQLQKKDKDKQLTIAEKEKKLQQVDAIKTQYNNRVRMYSLLATLGVFLLLAVILWRNNRQKQFANVLLVRQKYETDQQKVKAEKALDELKTTQRQLVQREKMASLGELTAGVAHEIQNPLNFVNNFSEVNSELVEEMEEEIKQGNLEAVELIAASIKQNMEKINLHGKRADGIVKSMLQHSRTGIGKAEFTGINTFIDEYIRLSYQGLRAKDKSFNAIIETEYDNSIQEINIVQQDIARVLLNIFNNAFYAVNEKKKQSGEGFDPAVSVITKKLNSGIEIRIRDNGMGIPEKILDKIYQPFFTTKPTGEGTGLGLSLSYDIITKGCSGSIRANTREGEFTEFIIQLPI